MIDRKGDNGEGTFLAEEIHFSFARILFSFARKIILAAINLGKGTTAIIVDGRLKKKSPQTSRSMGRNVCPALIEGARRLALQRIKETVDEFRHVADTNLGVFIDVGLSGSFVIATLKNIINERAYILRVDDRVAVGVAQDEARVNKTDAALILLLDIGIFEELPA